MYLKEYIQNLVKNGPASFNIHMEMTLTLTLNTICCLHLPNMSQAAMVSEKSTVFHFFLYKSLSYKIWPCRKKLSTQGHHLNKLWWARIIATYDGVEAKTMKPRRWFQTSINAPLLRALLTYSHLCTILLLSACRKRHLWKNSSFQSKKHLMSGVH